MSIHANLSGDRIMARASAMPIRLACLTVMALATPAAAADVTATARTIAAAWKTLRPGDRLVLTGDFPAVLVLADRNFSPDLRVDAKAATFAAVIIQRVGGVDWTGGTLRPTKEIGRPGLQGSALRNVQFTRLAYYGDGSLNGVNIRDSDDVTVAMSTFERPRVGISAYNVRRVRIVGNQIKGWNGDGIGLSATTDTLVERNQLADPLLVDKGLHPDGIQGYWGPIPNVRLTIRGNSIVGDLTQGIFVSANAAHPPPSGTVIEDNTVTTGHAPNGVFLQGDLTGRVARNSVSTLPGSNWQTRVFTTEGVSRCGNTTDSHLRWRGEKDSKCKDRKD